MSGDIINAIKRLEHEANPFLEHNFYTLKEAYWYDCTHCSERGFNYFGLEEHLLNE